MKTRFHWRTTSLPGSKIRWAQLLMIFDDDRRNGRDINGREMRWLLFIFHGKDKEEIAEGKSTGGEENW